MTTHSKRRGGRFLLYIVFAMRPDGRFVFAQLGPWTGLSEDWFQKLATVLARDGRFLSKRQRLLRSSDLASLFNAVMGGQTVQAVEVDTMLRQLVYKGSAPATQAPIFAPKSWGEVLEHVIEHASSGAGHVAEPANGDIRPGTLPHEIEVSLSPPLVTLIWRGPDGTVARRDWYGLAKPAPVSGALIRKTVIDGRVINVLADALRASAEGSSAGVRGAERTNAALLPQSTA